MTEHRIMNKPSRSFAKPLRDVVGKTIGEAFRRAGFCLGRAGDALDRDRRRPTSPAQSEPIKIQWQAPGRGPSSASPAR